MEHDVNDNTVDCDNYDNPSLRQDRADVLSPQPLITLTDMSDSTAAGRRQQVLYSEDFDAIQEYLQNTDSPMFSMSPSWLCRGTDASTVHVFPPTPVSHTVTSRPLTRDSNVTLPMSMTSQRPPTDVSSNMCSSSSLHAREVVHSVMFGSCLLICFLCSAAVTSVSTVDVVCVVGHC